MTREDGGLMSAGRMEAFSDGVIAIIITIMVLELKAPEEASAHGLLATWPIFLSYALSFTIVAIYWVNHHHLLKTCTKIDHRTLWLNIHWLFWLSLFPVTTAYMGETRGAPFAIAIYALLSMLVATAFLLLQRRLLAANAHIEDVSASTRRRTIKNLAAMASMAIAIPLAFFSPMIAAALLVVPALAYFIPD